MNQLTMLSGECWLQRMRYFCSLIITYVQFQSKTCTDTRLRAICVLCRSVNEEQLKTYSGGLTWQIVAYVSQ